VPSIRPAGNRNAAGAPGKDACQVPGELRAIDLRIGIIIKINTLVQKYNYLKKTVT
jgi:hypothetical protein